MMPDFNENPYIVIWETTRACALKCVHCRAEAIDHRDPRELSIDQAFRLLEEIRRFGHPLVVLTGGDPLRRPDLLDIIEYGTVLGLSMALTPSATPDADLSMLKKLKEKGLSRLAVSLDGSASQIHDSFRRVPGSYEKTLELMSEANRLGLSLQINTSVSRHNLSDFENIASLLEQYQIALWSVFFLVPMGRSDLSQVPNAQELEAIFKKMAALSVRASYQIKSTEAPQYRRVLLQSKVKLQRLILPVNDGKGFVFISHTGEIFPSGFLPMAAGNVKNDSLVSVYRQSPIFRLLRDGSQLKGKCGQCEFKSICGGSRARAYAVEGDPMASDPFCVHVPQGYTINQTEARFW